MNKYIPEHKNDVNYIHVLLVHETINEMRVITLSPRARMHGPFKHDAVFVPCLSYRGCAVMGKSRSRYTSIHIHGKHSTAFTAFV